MPVRKGSYLATMLPITVPSHFRIIAHRGASAYAPENTLAAFALAKGMGIAEIELDTQLTTDSQVFLCHDTTLGRYGHGSRNVESCRSTELAGLDMGSWFSPHHFAGEPILTLDRLFQNFGSGFRYHIELKGKAPSLPDAVIDRIKAFDLASHCFLTSFSLDHLLRAKTIDSSLQTGWLIPEIDDRAMDQAEKADLFQICPRAYQVTPQTVIRAREVAQEVRAWGLKGSHLQVVSLIRQVLQGNCDGVTIDWPDWLRKASESPPCIGNGVLE